MDRKLTLVNCSKPVKVLIVEDERIIACNLREGLESLGYVVLAIAASGEKAIEKATQLQPDLVLMDIQLKGNMDGIQAAEQIWNNLSIPVLYVSGHSDKKTMERATLTAPFGYILKPVQEQELYVAIRIALQRHEREQLLTAILKRMGDGVILVNAQNRIQFLNPVAESLTGWQQSEARNRELSEVFHIVDEQTHKPVDNLVKAALQNDTVVYLNDPVLLIAKNGTPIPIGDSIASIKDNNGVITGAVLVFRDMTQIRLAQERNLAMEHARCLELQMTEFQRLNQLKDDFLSTVSHELRTPLSNIKMAARLMETILNPEEQSSCPTHFNIQLVNHYLKILKDQCDQELALVNDLLDMQAIEANTYPLKLTPIQLQDWIPHIVESFEARIQVQQQRLQIILPPELPPLVSDLSSFTRILSELLNNACKYTPAGEQIVVTAQVAPLSPPVPLPNLSTTGIQIDVSNSGVEIPTEELSRIFDPFYRIPNNDPWKHSGTGLGLALAKKLLVKLQGTIDVTSNPDWTTFRIFIPNLESPTEEVHRDCN